MSKLTSVVFAGIFGVCGLSTTAWAQGISGDVGAGLSYQPMTRAAAATKPALSLTWTWTGAT